MIIDSESGFFVRAGETAVCPFCGFDLRSDPSDGSSPPTCSVCGFGRWFSMNLDGDFTVINPIRATLLPEDLDRLIDAVTAMKPLHLVLNLAGVQHISSAVLGKLLNLKSLVRFGRGSFALVNLRDDVFKIFKMTRLDDVFDIR